MKVTLWYRVTGPCEVTIEHNDTGPCEDDTWVQVLVKVIHG